MGVAKLKPPSGRYLKEASLPQGFDINWIAVLLVGGVGLGAVAGMFVASYILAPKRPSEIKDTPYECGIPPAPFVWSQIQIRYYVFAILFIIFDVEAVFLFPWAVVFLKATPAVFYEMLIFIGILFFGVVYGWRKGVLQWR
jgi:NADH-quinone oxidoreductase subunit A